MTPSLGSHALRALTPQTAVTVDRSRCVRHRCNRNECRKCMDVCPSGAICWDERGLHVSPNPCTQCLRCLAVCPTAALQSPGLSLLEVFTDLAAHPSPVLGCHHHPDSKAHARFPCLGNLAHPELILLLALVFVEGVQVNLSCCQGCPKGHILDGVHAAHCRLTRLLPEHRVKLVSSSTALDYQPSSLSRRDLFRLFRERSSRTAILMVDRVQGSTQAQSYGSKQTPPLRGMLLKAMGTLQGEQQQQIADELFGQVTFHSSCTACSGCIGVCSSGALQPGDEDKSPPAFDRELCVGCRSCELFCRKQGVSLTVSAQNSLNVALHSSVPRDAD